jgi:hypothetical protein
MFRRAIQTLFIFFHMLFVDLHAQDAHYWTQHYGMRSILLGSSVIGGAEDLGAIFYNPARLGLIRNSAFLISAEVYEWERLKVEDPFGENSDFSTSDFGGIPSLTAGTFSIGFLKKHRFAYSILIRQGMDLDFSYKNEVFGDVIGQFPGEEYFGGFVRLKQKVNEHWYSLSWSWPVVDWLSVGLNTTGTIYDQRKGNQIDLQAYTEASRTAIYRFNRNFSFTNYGLLWKAGVAAEFPHCRMGLTITTPTVVVSGKGKYQYENFYSGPDLLSGTKDVYSTSDQKDIRSGHRTPWAIGLGTTFLVGRHKLHLSGEWYSRIPMYTLMEAEPHISQSAKDTLTFQLVDQLNHVVNAGIGTEFYVSDKVSFYLSGNTDFSAVDGDISNFSENKPVARNSIISADFLHAALGFFFDFPGVGLTLGAARTGVRQKFARPVNFPEEGDDDIFARDEYASLKWERWRLVFSLSIPFLDDRLKKKTSNGNE